MSKAELIKPENQSLETDDQSKPKMQEMRSELQKICECLSKPTTEFDCMDAVSKIESYNKQYERILYSEISNFVFLNNTSGTVQRMSNMITNIDDMLDYVYSDAYQPGSTNDKQLIRKIALKICDHVNLAYQQCLSLRQSDDDFQKRFNMTFSPEREKITKDISSQLITLVSIFTAIAFILFGGISSMESMFSNARSIPIIKTMIIGCVWGLCMLNVVFVFLFCASKMTDLTFRSSSEDGSFVRSYPVVCWTNFILITILALLSCTYICMKDFRGTFIGEFVYSHQSSTCLIGYAVIAFIAWKVFGMIKKPSDSKKK